ncbi:MAG TPA: M23 family metallopeptidase [Vicinamibacterales bacterium]|nr:M23 family metallopeptidase [Vicinamibacterales bacterium]
MRKLLVAVVVLVLVALGVYVAAGFRPGPSITIVKPGDFAGATIPIELQIASPSPAEVQVFFEQNGTRTPLPGFEAPEGSTMTNVVAGAKEVPGFAPKAGPANLIVSASRKVWWIRRVTAEVSKPLTIRLEKPRVSVVSTKHYINLGGSEMIVYRATPADAASGVRVGDIEYPGFPIAGVKLNGLVTDGDPSTLRVAFFALRYDQPVNVPMKLFARDPTGEEATSDFDHLTFPKPFKKSTIPLEDKFLERVVPAVLAGDGAKDFKPTGTMIEQYVAINRELRLKNNATIKAMASQTSPEMLWNGVVFHPFTNTKAEAAFADFRTYVYQGREVDKQVHLGFDLASFANTPIIAANRGKVLFAGDLGIYGNCVVIDHGLGVQSLYGHLSSIAVKVGDMVAKQQELGKSGMTGLAGGDHLHFTMLVNGQMVNPIEWWDEHWINDRVLRKLRGK